jgi:hypothetical protein
MDDRTVAEEDHKPKKLWVYLDPWDEEMAARLISIGHEPRVGVVSGCDACGFLSMRGKDDARVVFDHCVCEIRKVHSAKCHLRRAAESPIDVGCDCEENDQRCLACYPCTCKCEGA